MNNGYLNYGHMLHGFSRWYEVHAYTYLETWESHAAKVGKADHFAALDDIGCPVYVSEPLPRVEKQVRVDWVTVFAHHFSKGAGNYFLGTPSLMLALALYEHDHGQTIQQIDSWGIDTSDPTHKQQRQSWAYWISQAHSRGIETGGTSTAFMAEKEIDGGLVGMRERVGDQIAKTVQAPGSTDYTIATMVTDNEPYTGHAKRLQAECAALGVPCYVRTLPAVSCRSEGLPVIRKAMTETVRQALDECGTPVVYMDADDNLLKLPTLPPDLDGAGIIDNPELQHYRDVCRGPCLPTGMIAAFTPTEKGRAALDIIAAVEAKMSYHRGVNALWAGAQRWEQSGVRDITAHFRGCIRINPSRGRTTTCYT